MPEQTITITLTVPQARVVRSAVDLLFRLRLGQVRELVQVWQDRYAKQPGDARWAMRDRVQDIADELRSVVYPELQPNASYGVGSPTLTENDNRAYELYKVIDHALWRTLPESTRPSWCTSADDPYLLHYSGDAKIPFTVTWDNLDSNTKLPTRR